MGHEGPFRPVQAECPLSVGKAVLRCCKGGRRGCADSRPPHPRPARRRFDPNRSLVPAPRHPYSSCSAHNPSKSTSPPLRRRGFSGGILRQGRDPLYAFHEIRIAEDAKWFEQVQYLE
jgi:hypothetical protein